MINVRKNYPPEFKARLALEAVEGEMTLAEMSASYGLHSNNILNWKKEFVENAPVVFQRKGDAKKAQDEVRRKDEEIEELYKQIGKLTVQVDWLKKKSRQAGLGE